MKARFLSLLLVVTLGSVVSGSGLFQCLAENGKCQFFAAFKAAIAKLNEVLGKLKANQTKLEADYPTFMYGFPIDGNNQTAVKYLGKVPDFNQTFTVCLWVQFKDFSKKTPVLRIINNTDHKNAFAIETLPPSTVGISSKLEHVVCPINLELPEPNILCISINRTTKLLSINHSGQYSTQMFMEKLPDFSSNEHRDLVLGGAYGDAQFNGYISNVVAYDRLVTTNEMQRMANICQRPDDEVFLTDRKKMEIIGDATYYFRIDCPTRKTLFKKLLNFFYHRPQQNESSVSHFVPYRDLI